MAVLSVTTSGTGASTALELPEDSQYVIVCVWAADPGNADLQAGFGSTFVDAHDVNGLVNITADSAYVVPGGMDYRFDVNTHTSALTATAHRVCSD